MHQLSAPDFSLQASLSSGQTFRWVLLREWYYGFIDGRPVKIRQEGDRLLFESSDSALTPERIRHYFALDVPLISVRGMVNRILLELSTEKKGSSHA